MTLLSAGSRRAPTLLLALAGLWTSDALAGKLVLSPLIPDASIDAKQRLAVHQLISSELEFFPEVEGVIDLKVAPPTLNDACLTNAKCLQGIAAANGGAQVMAGKLSTSGSSYVMDLVFFDGQTIARRKAYTVPQDATNLAFAMTPIVREMLTGTGSQSTGTKTASAGDFALDDDDDLSSSKGAAIVAPIPVSTASAIPLDDLEDPLPAPQNTGTDRRGTSAKSATAFVVAGAGVGGVGGAGVGTPSVPQAPTPDDDALARSISFGGKATDISAEEINAVSFSPPPGVGSSASGPAPTRTASSAANSDDLAFEEAELEDDDGSASLDDDTVRKVRSGSGGSSPFGGEIDHIAQITARGGYSKYYRFNFITGGGEAAVAVADGFHLIAGVEVYAVQRVLPPELQIQTGIFSQWNYIFPGNIGAIYKIPLGLAQPYVGADTIFVQYYKDKVGADWAIGGRFRAGVDLMVHENFGFNVNLAAGAWSGQNWSIIEQGVGRAGFLPQISAGTVASF